jgi:hypothetical protein
MVWMFIFPHRPHLEDGRGVSKYKTVTANGLHTRFADGAVMAQ